VLVLLAAGVGYVVYRGVQPAPAPPPPPGCQAGTGVTAIGLESDQAGIAATIAGVAARHHLPRQAVTIAYAAALQESQLHDLHYGDRDSVGVFQQRPSQGWGTTAEIEDPVYATTRFFAALVRVHDYAKLPIDTAAQDVQRSADGYAYEQWVATATLLTNYFTGYWPHGVSCWYTPPQAADLAGAVRELTATFGPEGAKGVVMGVTTDRSAKNKKKVAVVQVKRTSAWTVAGWLVANAQEYGIGEVRYAGYEWTAADGSMGWQPDSGPTSARDSIVAG
jgi:hypothetical protein